MIKNEPQRGFVHLPAANKWKSLGLNCFQFNSKANFLFLLFLISLESHYALSGVTLSSPYTISFLFFIRTMKDLTQRRNPAAFPNNVDPSLPDFHGTLSVSTGEGTGNPLQYSCLEHPLDGGAW